MASTTQRAAAAAGGAAAALVLAAAAGALIVAAGPSRPATYAGRSPGAATLVIAAGLTLAVGGLAMWFAARTRAVGGLALLAAFTWFTPVFVAWQAGPALVRSVAAVLVGFTFPLVAQAALRCTDGRCRSAPSRLLVGAMYVEALVVAGALALFRDPYADPGCWANCTVDSFLVRSLPSLARALEAADRLFVAGAAAMVTAVVLVRMLTASRPARVRMAPIGVPAIVFSAAVAARPIALQSIAVEDPFDPTLFAIFALACVGLILLGAGMAWSIVRTQAERRAVARIAADLDEAPAPGSLEAALARALGDRELSIAYWLPAVDGYVDANGRPVAEPTPRTGRAVTRLVDHGRTVAVIDHSGALETEIGPAVQLGIENERLQAELLAQLEELRASRARIVETADRERLRLERDLHDGAQQRMLALSYDIRLARASAQAEGETVSAQALARAIDEAQEAIDELRELARGIYPAALTEAGLPAALELLADSAPLPVEIVCADDRRCPPAVEAAAYFAIAAAIDAAGSRSADHATVFIERRDGRLIVTVESDGREGDVIIATIADRVGALGGTVGAKPTRVEIPCA